MLFKKWCKCTAIPQINNTFAKNILENLICHQQIAVIQININMKKVLGLGNALLDIIYRIENDDIINKYKLPRGGMQLVQKDMIGKIAADLKSSTAEEAAGGSASNTIHGIAGMGTEASLIGKIQNDAYGKILESSMIKAGIKPYLLKGKNETGTALTLVTPDSERTFAVNLGAALELVPEDLNDAQFEGHDILHIEGYLVQNHALMIAAMELAKKHQMKISLDLASYDVVENDKEFLHEITEKYVDIVFANEEESKAFTGKEPREALDVLAGLCEIAVVKIGKDGSYIKTKGKVTTIAPLQANPIDTTGAGDLYAGGFLYALIQGYDMEKCGWLGSLMAAKVIETIGAKLTESQWAEIKQAWNSAEN